MPLIGLNNVKIALNKTKTNLNTKLSIIYFKGLRDVITGTPVDKGRARSNWFLTVAKSSSQTTTSTKRSAIKSLEPMPNVVLNKKIYLSNNLPYIEDLEFGHSQQAPRGWVRKAVIKIGNEVRKL